MQTFFQKIERARKVLVMDLGFLGDSIHMIPALWAIRSALPQAQLELVVADHVSSIFDCTPWIDRVWGYPRFPKGPPWYKDLKRVFAWRKEGYDCVINLNGSDRSSLLTWGIGSRFRLGRVPRKQALFWKWCFTDTINVPHGTEPMYLQRLRALKESGFPCAEKPVFNITIPEQAQAAIRTLTQGVHRYVHISPFTMKAAKELPVGVLADFLNRVHREHPEMKVAISCANNSREKAKLEMFLKLLERPAWRVFPGTLSAVELIALINQACLHIGGDTGTLHVALMTEKPRITWFRKNPNSVEWMPQLQESAVVLMGKETPEGVIGVDAEMLYAAFKQMLKE